MQLDLFAHSRDVMLRNDLATALTQRDAATSRSALAQWACEYPEDPGLAAARLLVAALVQAAESPPRPPPGSTLAAARAYQRSVLAPAAAAMLGSKDAQSWLKPLWRSLALQHAHVPWDPALPDQHAAPLWLAAADWAQAEQAAAGIASWRRIPVPLAWISEARYRLAGPAGLDLIWPLLAELAWLAPPRLATLLQTLSDPLLDRLRTRFEEQSELLDQATDPVQALAWFPAWVLTDNPALAALLAPAQAGQNTPPEQGLRLLVQLLHLERQGRHHDLMARRKALRDLCLPLYQAYMATR